MLNKKNFFESFGVGVGTMVLEDVFDQDDYKDLRQCPMERRGFFNTSSVSSPFASSSVSVSSTFSLDSLAPALCMSS